MNLAEIQAELRRSKIDGWLFFDHHRRDPISYRVLGLIPDSPVTRRWFYFIPANGDPRGMVHQIEPNTLASLPGIQVLYAGWGGLVEGLRTLLGKAARIAMQYSPKCAIPYVSLVDAGTVELVRSLGVEVTSSADLVQYFESRWRSDQLEMHLEAGRRIDQIRRNAFDRISNALLLGGRITEWEVAEFIRHRFTEEDLITDHGPDVAVNANASNPHYEPKKDASAEIRPEDKVLIDMWAKLNLPGAVYYDITWVGYCGPRPPADYERVFTIVRDARNRAVRHVEKSVAAGEPLQGYQVDDVARSYIKDNGYGQFFFHRTGHSIGEEVHGTGANMDNLETHDERQVIAGTCFSIEPGIYLPEFGIRSEVDVYVGASEARVTGEVQDKLVLL